MIGGGSGTSCLGAGHRCLRPLLGLLPAGQGAYCTGGQDTSSGGLCWTQASSCTCC